MVVWELQIFLHITQAVVVAVRVLLAVTQPLE
jgi:hypothetical protein